MKRIYNFTFSALLVSCILFSCHHDNDDIASPSNPNDNELITTLKIKFTNTSNQVEHEYIYQDLDGNGAPNIFDTIRLWENAVYKAEILLLDETKNPVDTISIDVKEEGAEHQFFFTASNSNVSIAYNDQDENGVPLGLETTWSTGAKSTDKTGKVLFQLKHQGEDKPKSGNGDINIGNTDIEINFPVLIYTPIN